MKLESKPLSDKCKSNKCHHVKCVCGHCSLYHTYKEGCAKIKSDLTICECKKFIKVK